MTKLNMSLKLGVDTVVLDTGMLEIWKHILAIVAAAIAIVVSLGQAINAFKKSRHHDTLRKELESQADSTLSEASSKLKRVLQDDVKHFRRVGNLWSIGFVGVLATLIAEIIDTQLP
jgi:hypothetical protein